jgi:hypothetical protein
MITGRCVFSWSTGIAFRSMVFRVDVSNVRIPRSQRITSLFFPAERMYSADWSHSSIVAESPRFSRTGLWICAHSFRRSKFCMFRAPTWRMSAYFATTSTLSGDMTSVTIFIPVSSRASTRHLRPSSPSPWNEYGEVLGLKAPPRRIVTPRAESRCADSRIIFRLSPRRGLPLTTTWSPDAVAHADDVSSRFTSRLASL